MFTYEPYYPPLAITPFLPNGPFTYEMPHILDNCLEIVSVYEDTEGEKHGTGYTYEEMNKGYVILTDEEDNDVNGTSYS